MTVAMGYDGIARLGIRDHLDHTEQQDRVEAIRQLRVQLGDASDPVVWLSPVDSYSAADVVDVLRRFRADLRAAIGTRPAAEPSRIDVPPGTTPASRIRELQRTWVLADRALAQAELAALTEGRRAAAYHRGRALLAMRDMDRQAKVLIRRAHLDATAPAADAPSVGPGPMLALLELTHSQYAGEERKRRWCRRRRQLAGAAA